MSTSLRQAIAAVLCMLCPTLAVRAETPSPSRELAWALHYDPKTLDPAKADEQSAELVRYLTGGVLVRLNRRNLMLEPMLAERWTLSPDGKLLTIRLRPNLRFSDGTPLTSEDVVATLQHALAPATAAPVAEEFVEPAKVRVTAVDALSVKVSLPVPLAQMGLILDEIAIEPARRTTNSSVTAGPYFVSEYRHGEFVRLEKNPYFWKRDARGDALPYVQDIRLDVLANRETEELRFLRGDYAMLDHVPTEGFGTLARRMPGALHDLGPSLNTEQMWFNQAPGAPLPAYEKQWFTSTAFRNAVSGALHRSDMARIAFDGHATPATGYISPVNRAWYNKTLAAPHEDAKASLALLERSGFHKVGSQLFDREGHPVKFSLLTNTGNRSRERMAALIQQDLAALGMQVNIVTLDFPALIERLMHTSNYEAALLGLSNVQPDPSSMSNLWLSSSPNHQWNPAEKTPATPWEAEIDRNIQVQATTGDFNRRKAAVDRIQAIVAEQQPFIYLVYPNTLCAVSPQLDGVQLSVLQPDVASSIETVHWKAGSQ